MKIICKKANGKLIELINQLQVDGFNGKHLEFTDVIPTVRISRSFAAKSSSYEASNIEAVIEEIRKSIVENRNGIRCIVDDKPFQLVLRKTIKKSKEYKAISNIGVLCELDPDSVVLFWDSLDNIEMKDREVELTTESRFLDLCDELKKEVKDVIEESSEPDFEPITPTSTLPIVVSSHAVSLYTYIKNEFKESDLVETEDGEYAIQFLRDKLIIETKLKPYVIPYLVRMDNFIYSNLCDTKEHIEAIPKSWVIIHEELKNYHKDKKEDKDYTFVNNVKNRIVSYLKESGIELIEPQKDTEFKPKDKPHLVTEVKAVEVAEKETIQTAQPNPVNDMDKVRDIAYRRFKTNEAKKPTKEEKEEFDKELAEVDAMVKEIEEKAKEHGIIIQEESDQGGVLMVRKIKPAKQQPNKTELVKEVGNLRESVKTAYSGVIKSILVHMLTWDLEDLVETLLKARNEVIKKMQSGVEVERSKEIAIALLRCCLWISEYYHNRNEGKTEVQCVEMTPGEYIFVIERSNVPWIIDHKTLGMILQFESPEKELNIQDISREEFDKKYGEYMRASGLMNAVMHDELGIIDPAKIVKR